MKRYIRTSTSLTDLISRIKYFVVVDNIEDCNLSVINASEDTDADDAEYLLSLPDRLLSELTDDEIHSITNIDVLGRLAKLCEDRLTRSQINALRKEYAKKLPIDASTKQQLLALFKQCNKVIVATRKKNTDFIAEYDLSSEDILNILHSLKPSDFNSRTRNINYGHLGNNIIILYPNILIPNKDIFVGANLYVKLDIDDQSGDAIVYISLHPRDESKS